MQKAYDYMTSNFSKELEEIVFDLVDAKLTTKNIKDENGNETGEKEVSAKYEVEVPKKHGALSKLRFEVKVLEPYLQINPDSLYDKDFQITFENLEVSFVDSKRNVYFRALSCTVTEEV